MARIIVWRWLTRNVPEGQVMSCWQIGCHWVLFPRRSLLWWLQRDCGFDPLTCCWNIHGIRFSDRIFMAMAQPQTDILYRFERKPGSSLVTVYALPLPQGEVE